MNRLQTNQTLPLVLAVDDNEDQLLIVSYALMSFNCTFVTALDAQTALSIARNHCPVLILLDIVMPQISGVELVQQLKQDQRTRNIPVVAITALSREEEKEYLIASGCDAHLSKPYMFKELEAIIERYLGRTLFLPIS